MFFFKENNSMFSSHGVRDLWALVIYLPNKISNIKMYLFNYNYTVLIK